MGVDFHMDSKPRVKWRKVGEEWNTETYGLQSLVEDINYTDDVGHFEFVIEAQEAAARQDADPRWGYGGFGRVRKQVASAIGLDLDMMWGFKPYGIQIYEIRTGRKWNAQEPQYSEDYESEWWAANCKQWSEIDHPVVPFLDHSDCEGDLSWEQCAAVGPALKEINTPEHIPDEWDRGQLDLFVKLCEDCAKYKRSLIFC